MIDLCVILIIRILINVDSALFCATKSQGMEADERGTFPSLVPRLAIMI